MKDGGRISFLLEKITSGLMAVVMSTQPEIRTMSGQEATCQSAEIPV